VTLGRAELEEIKGEAMNAAGFGGFAIACLLLLALFLPIGGMLFLGEWLFGSIGWGLLLGAEALLAVAAAGMMLALRLHGFTRATVWALVVGIIAFVVLGASLPHWLFASIGAGLNLSVDPMWHALVAAVVLLGVVGALVGLVAGLRVGGSAGAAIGGLLAGLLSGVIVGAFLATDFGWRVGAALGFAAGLATWIAVLASGAPAQIDIEVIKARFYPKTTIDTAMETIEWAKAQNPLGRKS